MVVRRTRDHRGVYTIEALEQMLHRKSWGRILANLGGKTGGRPNDSGSLPVFDHKFSIAWAEWDE